MLCHVSSLEDCIVVWIDHCIDFGIALHCIALHRSSTAWVWASRKLLFDLARRLLGIRVGIRDLSRDDSKAEPKRLA